MRQHGTAEEIRTEPGNGMPMNAANRMANLGWMIGAPGWLGKWVPTWIGAAPALAVIPHPEGVLENGKVGTKGTVATPWFS